MSRNFVLNHKQVVKIVKPDTFESAAEFKKKRDEKISKLEEVRKARSSKLKSNK